MKTDTNNSTTFLSRWTRFLGLPLCAGLVLALMVPAISFSQYTNPTAIPLGSAGTYGALCYSGMNGSVQVNGDIGSSSSTVIGVTCTGTNWTTTDNNHNLTAQNDLATALDQALNHRAPDVTDGSGAISGTLTPGVYSYTGASVGLTGTLTLDGGVVPNAVFIIKTAAILNINSGATVTLAGTAVWSNVFWYVGSSATIFDGTTFYGIVLAEASITLNASAASVTAKLLAHTGAVTVSSNVLPVELVSFTATANRMDADLHWSTATEVNNYGFDVERRLINSQSSTVNSWTKIGFVEGNGTSNSAHSYSYTDASVSSGTCAYRLKQIDNNGTYKYSSETEITIAVPKVVALNQNYPNPFNPTTTITFTLAQDGFTTLKIYDVLGREVTTLVNGEMKSGVMNAVSFNASKLSSGVYFSRLESSGNVQMKTLMLLK